ncbi:MAG: DUF4411 family protein [archaeon]
MTSLIKTAVIDTCSLSNFLRYYIFDRGQETEENYEVLFNFFIEKIKKKELIVIDKVIVELLNYDDPEGIFKYFATRISKLVTNTDNCTDIVKSLYKDYEETIKSNLSKKTDNEEEKSRQISKYQSRDADLYLVAYCIELNQLDKTILITDENSRQSPGFPKIPNICKDKGIMCDNLPNLIFKHYNSEITFKITKSDSV